MEDFEVLDHQDSMRTVELKTGNKLNLKRSDPYGFWTIHYEKGQVPVELQGQFTSDDEAMKAVNVYLSKKQPTQEADSKKI